MKTRIYPNQTSQSSISRSSCANLSQNIPRELNSSETISKRKVCFAKQLKNSHKKREKFGFSLQTSLQGRANLLMPDKSTRKHSASSRACVTSVSYTMLTLNSKKPCLRSRAKTPNRKKNMIALKKTARTVNLNK